jgi:hypothetical protein
MVFVRGVADENFAPNREHLRGGRKESSDATGYFTSKGGHRDMPVEVITKPRSARRLATADGK